MAVNPKSNLRNYTLRNEKSYFAFLHFYLFIYLCIALCINLCILVYIFMEIKYIIIILKAVLHNIFCGNGDTFFQNSLTNTKFKRTAFI